MRKGSVAVGVAAIVAAALAACIAPPHTTSQRVDAPLGAYLKLDWQNESQLVVWYEINVFASEPWESTPRFFSPDGELLRELPKLPLESERCAAVLVEHFETTRDGRVVGMFWCQYGEVRGGQPDQPGKSRSVWLGIWDQAGEHVELLRPYELPHPLRTFTMSPDLGTGVLATRSPLGKTWDWLDEDGLRPLEHGLARANRPAWSPDGQWIAFFGNEEEGPPDISWAADRFDVMLLPADCREHNDCSERIEILASGFTGAISSQDYSTLSWSPDSRWIAFGGGDRRQGIWLLDVETRELVRAVSGHYRNPTWSPDGRTLMFIGPPPGGWPDDPVDSTASLYTADVSEIVGGAR